MISILLRTLLEKSSNFHFKIIQALCSIIFNKKRGEKVIWGVFIWKLFRSFFRPNLNEQTNTHSPTHLNILIEIFQQQPKKSFIYMIQS